MQLVLALYYGELGQPVTTNTEASDIGCVVPGEQGEHGQSSESK